jgi:hypothetical protein
MTALRHFLLALQFFTRIPVTGRLADWVGFSPAMLRASAAHFPGVGCLVGTLVAALSAVLWWALPQNFYAPLVVAALGTAAGILLTGAFHEDGLADVAGTEQGDAHGFLPGAWGVGTAPQSRHPPRRKKASTRQDGAILGPFDENA